MYPASYFLSGNLAATAETGYNSGLVLMSGVVDVVDAPLGSSRGQRGQRGQQGSLGSVGCLSHVRPYLGCSSDAAPSAPPALHHHHHSSVPALQRSAVPFFFHLHPASVPAPPVAYHSIRDPTTLGVGGCVTNGVTASSTRQHIFFMVGLWMALDFSVSLLSVHSWASVESGFGRDLLVRDPFRRGFESSATTRPLHAPCWWKRPCLLLAPGSPSSRVSSIGCFQVDLGGMEHGGRRLNCLLS
ncbi:hypothetical protein B0T25DRAFT_124251 [Lasiosphaeria hispida]|uniref:Uncharacterized protein n=1 Tax=Lasiosphaeria hispida TaxID=260671 RepID=A0AAJ0HRT9_9PEZI|nr:hypothetical protein B0T25DRAFT_124251 [Lasiosphaeria hispida]